MSYKYSKKLNYLESDEKLTVRDLPPDIRRSFSDCIKVLVKNCKFSHKNNPIVMRDMEKPGYARKGLKEFLQTLSNGIVL